MSTILRMSDATSIAMHTMAYLADKPDKLVSTGQIASTLRVSEAHLAKVLQRLSKAGLVESARGPKGGFRLAKSPEKIPLIDIYEVIEGPVPHRECMFGKKVCKGEHCIFNGLIGTMNRMFADHLKNRTVSQLTGTYGGNDVYQENRKD